MSSLSESAYQKELAAQKKRAQALEYLQTNGCGPTSFEKDINTRGATKALGDRKPVKTFTTDNTLEQIRKQRAREAAGRTTELSAKSAILLQQEEMRKSREGKSELPPNWEAVVDKESGKTYYWNKSTNVTSWERPAPIAASRGSDSNSFEDSLPPGWVAVVHSATGQIYYSHQGTGEKRWTRPESTDDTSDIPVSGKRAKSDVTEKQTSARTRPKETAAQQQEKRRRIHVDPLDPTGGMVSVRFVHKSNIGRVTRYRGNGQQEWGQMEKWQILQHRVLFGSRGLILHHLKQ